MQNAAGREGAREVGGRKRNRGKREYREHQSALEQTETPGRLLRPEGGGALEGCLTLKPENLKELKLSIISLFQAGLEVWRGHSEAPKYIDNQEKERVLN